MFHFTVFGPVGKHARTVALVTASLAAAAAGSLGISAEAHAAPSAPAPAVVRSTQAQGVVHAHGGLIARSLPTTFAKNTATVPDGSRLELSCAVTGTVVGSGEDVSNTWYRLPASEQWVSARYVRADRRVAYCGTGARVSGTVTRTVARYEAPTTKSNSHAAFTKGESIKIICQLKATSVGGDRHWYNTTAATANLWIPAHDVKLVGAAPTYCTN